MNDLKVFVILFLMGVLSHRMMIWVRRLGNRGESEVKEQETKTEEVKFTPEQQKLVDHVIETRLAREKAKFADYEELVKFKQEVIQKQDKHQQEELEKAKKYEEAKKNYEGQLNQHKELLSKKDLQIADLQINHALINEINKQNGYAEETLALLKSSAVLNTDGSVTIKSKDANGIDIQLPVGEGVKRFLEARPYLVKSTHKAGTGSTPNTQPVSEGTPVDLSTLNAEYSAAMTARDWKKVNEIGKKIRSTLTAKGVTTI